jgi:hypothetical protein
MELRNFAIRADKGESWMQDIKSRSIHLIGRSFKAGDGDCKELWKGIENKPE